MKRFSIILAAAFMALTSCTQKEQNILVAYFSATGTTEAVAKDIAAVTGGDIFEISPTVPYTAEDLDWRNKQSRSSIEMTTEGYRTEFTKNLEDPDSYDIIYIGFPIWWNTAPTAVNAFVEEYGFSGKKCVMFATSGGGSIDQSIKDFKATYPEIEWVDAKLLNGATEDSIQAWIKELKLR